MFIFHVPNYKNTSFEDINPNFPTCSTCYLLKLKKTKFNKEVSLSDEEGLRKRICNTTHFYLLYYLVVIGQLRACVTLPQEKKTPQYPTE
jgi:hypothetical protein